MVEKIKFVKFEKAKNNDKKLRAVFFDENKKRKATREFGASGASDFTKNKDKERKERYLDRHRARENWNDFTSRGALSRWILWNLPNLAASKADFAKRFGLKIIR